MLRSESKKIPTSDMILGACVVWRQQGRKFVSTNYPNSNNYMLKNLQENFQDEVLQEDRDLAADIVVYLTEELVMKKLSGVFSEFEQSMLTVMSLENVGMSDLGKISYLPEMYHKSKHREQEQQFFRNSQYLGRPGERIELDIRLVRQKSIQTHAHARWNRHQGEMVSLLICTDALQNMIKIFHRELVIPSDKSIQIKAKVKKHDPDLDFGVPSTILNYVKLV